MSILDIEKQIKKVLKEANPDIPIYQADAFDKAPAVCILYTGMEQQKITMDPAYRITYTFNIVLYWPVGKGRNAEVSFNRMKEAIQNYADYLSAYDDLHGTVKSSDLQNGSLEIEVQQRNEYYFHSFTLSVVEEVKYSTS